VLVSGIIQMIEALIKNQEIAEFLELYPKDSWTKALQALLGVGIQAIYDKSSVSQTDRLVHGKQSSKASLKQQLMLMKQDSENLSPALRLLVDLPQIRRHYASSKSTLKRPPPAASKFKSKGDEGKKSSHKSTQSVQHTPDHQVPKYLTNVQSRISGEVHRDIAKHRHASSVRDNTPSQSEIGWMEGSHTPESLDLGGVRGSTTGRSSQRRGEDGASRHSERPHTASRREAYDHKPKRPEEAYEAAQKPREELGERSSRHNQPYEPKPYARPGANEIRPYSREAAAKELPANREPLNEQHENRYDFPRQISKTPPRPPLKCALIEPKTCSFSAVSHLLSGATPNALRRSSLSETGDLLRIANQFLTDPCMSQLARTDSRLSIPSSPKHLEEWLSSKERLFN
jgi:hypothetical protein